MNDYFEEHLQTRASILTDSTPMIHFSTNGSKKMTYWCEIGHVCA